jgi:acetate kinase
VPAGIIAVGHRIVHGGPRFRKPVLLDETVERDLERLTDLAPLHNQPALTVIEAARRTFPDLPQVAVFDTAFHATMPEEAATYPLPARFRDEWGIRRYGFHGLSVQWASERVRVPRLVVCHLGGGCSVTAVRDGSSIDTTMGFTPLEGPPMATRSGSIDPGALLHLLRTGTITIEELDHALEHDSGLLGLSALSDSVEQLERSIEPTARLALSVYTYRIATAIGAMATALGGIDALVFTAGVGEHSAQVRSKVCDRLHFLGLELDAATNTRAAPDVEISSEGSSVRVHVVRACEEIVVARAVRALLETTRPPARSTSRK